MLYGVLVFEILEKGRLWLIAEVIMPVLGRFFCNVVIDEGTVGTVE